MERIETLIKLLKMNRNQFASGAGIATSNLAKMLSGQQKISDKTLHKIEAAYNVNFEWLKTGEGEVFCEEPKSVDNSSPCFDLVPIQGGMAMGNGTEQLTKDMSIGMMSVPGVPVGSSIPYIKVRGTSMVNRRDPAHSIPEGAWIGIRPSNSSVFRWGEVYAIMTTDGPVVKKVMPSEQEGCIKCVSFNEEDGFLPFELPTNEIIQPLYQVVAVITAKPW